MDNLSNIASDQLNEILARLLDMENRQQTFEQAVGAYLMSLAGEVMTLTMNYAGNAVADCLYMIPYIGPTLATLARTFIPYAFKSLYRGISL